MDCDDPFLVASFYRFVGLPNYKDLRDPIGFLAREGGIKGTVLLASEGINSTIAGLPDAVLQFLQGLRQIQDFGEMDVKFSRCGFMPFRRLRIRLKKEIVTLKRKVDPNSQVGRYVDPGQWNAVLADPNILVVDVRNVFEVGYGTFEGAVNPQTEDFSEFPRFVDDTMPDRSRPVALFCTGGIRCEKATSYLLAQGFSDVMHLRGGILNYLEKVPPDQSRWLGACFVFDEREALDHGLRPIRLGSPNG